MRRIAMAFGLVALLPLVLGAGGSLPPPFASKVSGNTYTFTAVMDPHMAAGDPDNTAGGDITPTAKQATIRIYRNNVVVAAVFKILPGFALFRGCDLSLTEARFLHPNGTLKDWIPQDTLQALFNTELGEPISPTRLPTITRIDDARCTSDPNQTSISDGGDGQPSVPGVLSLQGVIRFAVPK